MRTSRNMHQNQGGIQSRIKQFRGRVGQRLVGKTKLKASSRRRFFNGVSPLNRNNVQDTHITLSGYTQYHSSNARQNRFSQQRGQQVSQNQNSQRGYHQKRQSRGRGWNGGMKSSSSHVGEQHRRQDTTFQTGPIVRGRLKSNYGFMRSDTIFHKQQLKQDLQKLQLQQQQHQQQHWVAKSWQRLTTKAPRQMQSSARTAMYEPSSSATVTIQIQNTADSSSDVSVIFGKKSKRSRVPNDAFARSVALQQQPEASRLTSVKFESQNQSVVSFEDFDVDVESAGNTAVNSLPFHLVSRKPASSTDELDCGILIV